MSKEMVSQLEVSAMIQRIKQEPLDEETPNNKQCNGLSKETPLKRKSTEDISAAGQTGLKKFRHLSENAKPTIPCLMCDRYLENQDELMIHMALDHQCSQQGSRRQVGRIPKHTCQICFAKFRTLRDLFTHTAFHAKQLQFNGEWASELGTRMEKNIMKQGAIRQYFSNLQNNLNGDVQHGTFKCDCCHNIFMNRDTYAMHVMMRVKDETCKSADMHLKKSSVKENGSDYGETIDLVPSQSGQEFLIDVTSSVNEDEYLKSALSVEVSNQRTAKEESKFQPIQGIKCMCCAEHFLDQDAMAMHVMTVHAATKKQQMASLNHQKESATGQQIRKVKKNQDHSNDITIHEFFRCQFCGSIFESRDVLSLHVLTQHAKENGNSTKRSNEKDNKDTKDVIKMNNDDDKSTYIVQNEPLNLVSEKKPKESHKVTEHQTDTTIDMKEPVISSHVLTQSQADSKVNLTVVDDIRRARSASLPNVGDSDFTYISRPRPASTGNIENRSYFEKVSEFDNSVGSPITYRYEQPEPYIDDREHSCQFMASPQTDPLELLLQKREHAHMCGYCEIIFLNRTLYYLHMGLHNVNNPLQCNMCGKTCENIHDFSAHVMHL